MKEIAVNGANVVSVGYLEKQCIVVVKQRSGCIWHYTDVSQGEFDALVAAKNVVAHLNQFIVRRKLAEMIAGPRKGK